MARTLTDVSNTRNPADLPDVTRDVERRLHAQPGAPSEPARILIVEDEAIVALDIRSQLESFGYRVVGSASTAEQAIKLAHQHQPDLVLMDVHLAGTGDGISAAAQIRQWRPIPVIFLTAFVDAETLERAGDTAPYGYIIKPFESRDLQAGIQMALARAERDRQVREAGDTLLSILDTQRQGTVLLNARGECAFLSRSAEQLLGITTTLATGRPWQSMFNVSTVESEQLSAMIALPSPQREKVLIHLQNDNHPARAVEVEVQDDPRHADRRLLFLYDVSQLHDLRRLLDDQASFENLVGKSPAMMHVFSLIRDFAAVDSTVLIEGETGTGKEMVARAIHAHSHRANKPFVALNCAGLTDELALSQLFGHRRGAFTGAVEDRAGLFEAAEGGTLLLDELAELSPRAQTMLLRALEERAIMRVGETKTRPFNVRLIAAANRDLNAEVAAQRFRADLLYRIRVARIRLPRLIDRREDVPLLARKFLVDVIASTGKPVTEISNAAMGLLMSYDWPGNIRELRNAIEFAVVRCSSSTIQADDLPPEIVEVPQLTDLLELLSGDERSQILSALERARGNRKEAAQLLGISRATLYRRLEQHGIENKAAS